jgi:hypothetical protein
VIVVTALFAQPQVLRQDEAAKPLLSADDRIPRSFPPASWMTQQRPVSGSIPVGGLHLHLNQLIFDVT